MNSKKLCCICVLFSLLAGCASESSIDEKKKKAQVTQSNINIPYVMCIHQFLEFMTTFKLKLIMLGYYPKH